MDAEYEIYTDGGCSGNGKRENVGGWGFVVVKNDVLIYEVAEVDCNTTNNRQEIKGVLNSLFYCYDNNITSFIIYCDSQYVVNGITKWIDGWAKKGWIRMEGYKPVVIPNADLWRQVFVAINKFDNVNIKWIRGHNGNKWNEYIDTYIQKHIFVNTI